MTSAAPKKIRHDRRTRRAELTREIADLFLSQGVAQIPLRELAQKLGVSDRMLLYYFSDKADLVRCSLEEVSKRLAGTLAQALPSQKSPPKDLILAAAPLLLSKSMAPYINVWADISARGGRGEAPFEDIARTTIESWLLWLQTRLDLAKGGDPKDVAAAILIALEGARLIEAFAPGAASAPLLILASSFEDASAGPSSGYGTCKA